MKSSKLLFIAAAAAAYCATSIAASALTIVDARLYANAWDGVGADGEQLFTSLAFPAGGTITGTDGGNVSSMTVSHMGSGDQATFSYGLDLSRTGYSLAQGGGQIKFTVGAATTYDLSGIFSAHHLGAANSVSSAGYLADLTTSSILFGFSHASSSAIDPSFTLGSPGSSGSLSGNLVTGHTYMFTFGANITAYPNNDAGATGTGNFTLKIGGGAPAASVPDSGATFGLLALGLATLAGARRQLARH